MKISICIFATLLGLQAWANPNVFFDYDDFTSSDQTNRILSLYFLPAPQTNGMGQIITRDRIRVNSGTNGSVTVSNVFVGTGGGDYRGEFAGTSATTTNFFHFPVTNGLINAADFVSSPTNITGGFTAYTTSQSDARYYPLTSNPSNYFIGPTNAQASGLIIVATSASTSAWSTNSGGSGGNAQQLFGTNATAGAVPAGAITNSNGGGMAIELSTNKLGVIDLFDSTGTNYAILGAPTLSKTVFGHQALNYQYTHGTLGTFDSEDTAFGNAALYSLPGTNNSFTSAFGSDAGFALLNSFGGAIFGQKAMVNATNQGSTVAFGAKALATCTFPARDTAIGYAAIQFGLGGDLTGPGTGGDRVAIGYSAGQYDDGQQNLYIGSRSGPSTGPTHGTGYGNIALGFGALSAITSGILNVGIGYNALNSVTSDAAVVGIGANVFQLGHPYAGIGIGYQAGQSSTAGTSSIYIGLNAGINGSISHSLIIGGNDPNGFVTNCFVGADQNSANAAAWGPLILNTTGGSGANNGGMTFVLAAGRSTGNANGGDLNLAVSLPGSSGSSLNSLTNALNVSGQSGVVTIHYGVSSTAINTSMTTTSTGCTNSTGMVQIAYVTAATGAALTDNAGNTEFSSVTISAFTPIRIQNGGKFTGSGITYAAGSAAHAW